MGFFSSIFKSVTKLLGLSAPKAPAITIPKPAVPAAPAPTTRTDTGAIISIGTTVANKDQRVSGGGRRTSGRSAGDILGGLGRGGLSI